MLWFCLRLLHHLLLLLLMMVATALGAVLVGQQNGVEMVELQHHTQTNVKEEFIFGFVMKEQMANLLIAVQVD